MFERFTERARQVVTLAQEVARGQGAETITTGHLLIGLLREEGGLAARVLASRDITEERVLGVGEWPKEPPVAGQLPFTPKAKHALELALREALSLGHNYIGTEHILLGLIREDDGATEILRSLEVDGDVLRADVVHLLGAGGSVAAKSKPVGHWVSFDAGDFDIVLWALRRAAAGVGPNATRANELVALFTEPSGDLVMQVAELSRRLNALEHTYSLTAKAAKP